MILQVVDANGVTQQIAVAAPGTPVDRSGTCDGLSNAIMDAVADGFVRSGWLVQNKSQTAQSMTINDLGDDADESPTCVNLAPGEFFPPANYPVTQGQISLKGADGDAFMAREWLTPIEAEA